MFITLASTCHFYCHCLCAFVAMATKAFSFAYNGKWKLAFIAISLQIFWQEFYRNVPWVVLYQTYYFCPNLWIFLIKKIIASEAIKGIKLKFHRNVHNLSLYKNDVCRCLCFHCYGNLKFPLAYNGKSENWHLLLPHCRYFDKRFTEMIVEWSSTKHTI